MLCCDGCDNYIGQNEPTAHHEGQMDGEVDRKLLFHWIPVP